MSNYPVNSNREVVRTEITSKGCYRLEKIKCGSKRCKCVRGELHGPYWYFYFYKFGALNSKYIGKTLDYTIHSRKTPDNDQDKDMLEQILNQIDSKIEGAKKACKKKRSP